MFNMVSSLFSGLTSWNDSYRTEEDIGSQSQSQSQSKKRRRDSDSSNIDKVESVKNESMSSLQSSSSSSSSSFPPRVEKKAKIEEKGEPVTPVQKPIDVPDDGNCLFYAFTVGLAMQHRLEARFDPNQIIDTLGQEPQKPQELQRGKKQSKEEQEKAAKVRKEYAAEREVYRENLTLVLSAPAAHLREQAADWLHDHQNEDLVKEQIGYSIQEHNEAVENHVKTSEADLRLANENVKAKKINVQHFKELSKKDASKKDHFDKQIKENSKQYDEWSTKAEDLQAAIAAESAKVLDADNVDDFIDMFRADYAFAGTPHINALAYLYDCPVNIKEGGAIVATFNEEGANPAITIAHVNGNHYQYVPN